MREGIVNKMQAYLFQEDKYGCVPQRYFVGPKTGVLYVIRGFKGFANHTIEHAIPEVDRRGRERGMALKRTAMADGFNMDSFEGTSFAEAAVRGLEIAYITCAEEFLTLAQSKNPFVIQKLQEIAFTEAEQDFLVNDCGLAALAEPKPRVEFGYYR